MKKNWKKDDLIVRCLADSYLPIALVLGFYVILHGNISPGGGFQGGVLAASGVLLLYLGYGFRGVATALNMERMHKLEALGAIAYVFLPCWAYSPAITSAATSSGTAAKSAICGAAAP